MLYKKRIPANFPPASHPLTPAEQERFSYLLSHQLGLDPWRALAKLGGFLVESLDPTVRELLDILEKRLIRGKGWHRNDRLKNLRTELNLSPSKLACGRNCPTARTYQRAVKFLIEYGLIVRVGKASDQSGIYRPTWWLCPSSSECIAVWRAAAQIAESKLAERRDCRTAVALVTDPCRTYVAPDHPADACQTIYSPSQLHGSGNDASAGRITENDNVVRQNPENALKRVSSLSPASEGSTSATAAGHLEGGRDERT